MGQEAFAIELVCRHEAHGEQGGALVVEGAQRADSLDTLPLPPSDGPLVLEYVRVPAQEAPLAGSDAMAVVGRWTSPFTMVLWLHRDAEFDDGTDLSPDEYDLPPEQFGPVVTALHSLVRPWKLGPAC